MVHQNRRGVAANIEIIWVLKDNNDYEDQEDANSDGRSENTDERTVRCEMEIYDIHVHDLKRFCYRRVFALQLEMNQAATRNDFRLPGSIPRSASHMA